jgi:hypothetical protein
MSLQLHDFFARHAEQGSPIMIVEGDSIVAHVHDPEYLQMFLHAPEMISLIEKLAAMDCNPSRPDHDSESCAACQARILLANMYDDPDGWSTGRQKMDMLG